MIRKAIIMLCMGTTLAGCATSGTRVLPSYTLENGARLQDVVTTAGDPNGAAPTVVAVTTYDITTPGVVAMVARDQATGKALGPAIATAVAGGVALGVPLIAAAAIRDADKTLVQSTSYNTSGNVAYGGGDAGDIDAATQATLDCARAADCDVSN